MLQAISGSNLKQRVSVAMEKELVCIVCPIGCRLKITGETDNLQITGNKCKRE